MSTTEYPKLLAIQSFEGDYATDPFSIVLRDFGPTERSRFVTHCRSDVNNDHYWGHYFSDERTAREDFSPRCNRYVRN